MSRKAIVSGQQYLLYRKCPRTGFDEQLIYEGSLKQKPKGWTLVRSL